MDVEEIILKDIYKAKIKAAMRSLSHSEQELIIYVYFSGYTLKRYAEDIGISYNVAYGRKVRVLGKLKRNLDSGTMISYLN